MPINPTLALLTALLLAPLSLHPAHFSMRGPLQVEIVEFGDLTDASRIRAAQPRGALRIRQGSSENVRKVHIKVHLPKTYGPLPSVIVPPVSSVDGVYTIA